MTKGRIAAAHGRYSLHFTIGHTLPLLIRGSGPPSNSWFLGPTQVNNPNGIWIGSSVCVGTTIVTDHATLSVTIGSVYNIWPNKRGQSNLDCSIIFARLLQCVHPYNRRFLRPTRVQIPTRMWANGQRDGRPAEHAWCPLFNAAKCG